MSIFCPFISLQYQNNSPYSSYQTLSLSCLTSSKTIPLKKYYSLKVIPSHGCCSKNLGKRKHHHMKDEPLFIDHSPKYWAPWKCERWRTILKKIRNPWFVSTMVVILGPKYLCVDSPNQLWFLNHPWFVFFSILECPSWITSPIKLIYPPWYWFLFEASIWYFRNVMLKYKGPPLHHKKVDVLGMPHRNNPKEYSHPHEAKKLLFFHFLTSDLCSKEILEIKVETTTEGGWISWKMLTFWAHQIK